MKNDDVMAKETAITFLYIMRAENLNLDDLYTKNRYDALTLAIRSLEQKTESPKTLDEIRAEIQDTGAYEQEVNGKTEFVKGITYCLNIIDKYKNEEDENNDTNR